MLSRRDIRVGWSYKWLDDEVVKVVEVNDDVVMVSGRSLGTKSMPSEDFLALAIHGWDPQNPHMMVPEAKLVIVMRKDLGMRKGKMVAQGGHAASSWLAKTLVAALDRRHVTGITPAQKAWIEGRFIKVCVGVDSEAELEDVAARAEDAGLTVARIVDAGLTEFGGPTFTCVGIGPHFPAEMDEITGGLKLL